MHVDQQYINNSHYIIAGTLALCRNKPISIPYEKQQHYVTCIKCLNAVLDYAVESMPNYNAWLRKSLAFDRFTSIMQIHQQAIFAFNNNVLSMFENNELKSADGHNMLEIVENLINLVNEPEWAKEARRNGWIPPRVLTYSCNCTNGCKSSKCDRRQKKLVKEA